MEPRLHDTLLELNRKGLSVFPLSGLNAVSLYIDDAYENYDYDIVTPGQREKLVRLLKGLGFRQLTGRVIANSDKSVVFELPRPNYTLGDDPASQAEKLMDAGSSIVVITPTQALLTCLKRFEQRIRQELAEEDDRPLVRELVDLVYEQPANLDKVREWLGPTRQTGLFVLLKNRLRDSQREGIIARRQYGFSSRIADRLESMRGSG